VKVLMNVFSATIVTLLAVVAIADVVIYGYVISLRQSVGDSRFFYRGISDTATNARPGGYNLSNVRLTVNSNAQTGWAVRYASRFCKFCQKDEPKWQSLKSHLASNSYLIFTIPVTAAESYPEHASALSGTSQISYVDVEWIKRYRLSATPTTLIFNRSGKIIWTHAGTMTDDDEKSAIHAIDVNR
jgi:hypothetical protein